MREGFEVLRTVQRLHRRKFHDHTMAVFFRQPHAAGAMKRAHEFIPVDHVPLFQSCRNGKSACIHGVKFTGLMDVQDQGAHVIQRFILRLLARSLHDATGGAVAGKRHGDLILGHMIGHAVRTEKSHVAILQCEREARGLDLCTHAERTCEDVGALRLHVCGGERVQLSFTPETDGGVSEIDAVQRVSLDHDCGQRGHHFCAFIAHL